LQESEFPLWLGIEVVCRFKQSAKQFEGKARSEKPEEVGKFQASNGKSEVMVRGCHVLLVGGYREKGISGKIRPYPVTGFASAQFSSHKYYSSNAINFTEITVTMTQVTRVFTRLVGGGISPCGDVI
jgi:hypothetical protein